MKKRGLALILSLVMTLSMIPITAFGAEFTDMPNDWSTVALENAVANGLLKGDNGKIRAGDNLKRAEMATIVNRAFNAVEKAPLTKFTDVTQSKWYYEEMAKAVQMETFIGSGDKLNPEQNITREEAFVVLARAFKIQGKETTGLDGFLDKDNISDWAKEEVAALVSAGYVAGSNGQINPKSNITRAEFAKIMDNLVSVYITQAGEYITDLSGNVMVNTSGVTLKGITITGDLIIGDGVSDEDVIIDDTIVTGRVLVRGGGEDSIKIMGNSNIKNLIIAKVNGKVRIYSEDGTEVGEVIVDGKDDVILEGNFTSVSIISQGVTLYAKDANIELAVVSGQSSKIIVDKDSTINKIMANANDVKVEGKGKVKEVLANANNIVVTVIGANVTAGENTTGVKAGDEKVLPGKSNTVKEVVEEPSSGGGGGGGGGGSTGGGGDPGPGPGPVIPPVPTKVKLSFISQGKEIATSIDNNYVVKLVVPQNIGFSTDINLKLELKNVPSLGVGVDETRTSSIEIKTGLTSNISGNNIISNSLLPLKKSTIVMNYGDNKTVTYNLSQKTSGTNHIWTMTPANKIAASEAWQYVLEELVTLSKDTDTNEISIPSGAYLKVGNQKLSFTNKFELKDITSDFSIGDIKSSIREASSLVDDNNGSEQISLFIPEDSVLRIGQNKAVINKNLSVKINGLEIDQVDLDNILPAARDAQGLIAILENLNILNKISTGMNNKTITIQLSNLE